MNIVYTYRLVIKNIFFLLHILVALAVSDRHDWVNSGVNWTRNRKTNAEFSKAQSIPDLICDNKLKHIVSFEIRNDATFCVAYLVYTYEYRVSSFCYQFEEYFGFPNERTNISGKFWSLLCIFCHVHFLFRTFFLTNVI